MLEPPKAGLAHAVGTLAANELKQRQGGCPRGRNADKGAEDETVLLEVETFPLPPGREGAGRAKLPVPWPTKADHSAAFTSVLFARAAWPTFFTHLPLRHFL